jgi:hypothetical protein
MATPTAKKQGGVKVRLVASGRAQLLKKTTFSMRPNSKFVKIQMLLRKMLSLEQGDALFLFVNSCFIPNSNELMGTLFENFQVGGELIINYSREISWG